LAAETATISVVETVTILVGIARRSYQLGTAEVWAIAAIVPLSCQQVERAQEATGSTIPHIVAALHIATARLPIDLAVSHAVTHSHGDNRAPDNNLAGKVAISRALDPAAVA
jgi:hypothetical protein